MRTPTELERIRRIRKDLSELTGVDLLEVTALALRKLKDEFHPRLAGLVIGRVKGQDEMWLRTLEDGRQDKGYEFRLGDDALRYDAVDALAPAWRQLREQIALNVSGRGEPGHRWRCDHCGRVSNQQWGEIPRIGRCISCGRDVEVSQRTVIAEDTQPRRPLPDPRVELQAMFRKHGILGPGEEL
jgi:hypothetical protein